MQNLLLKNSREQLILTPQQIQRQTGIPARRYTAYEEARQLIDSPDATLLGTLLHIKPEYLTVWSLQLELLRYRKELEKLKDEKVAALTKALKEKMSRQPATKKSRKTPKS